MSNDVGSYELTSEELSADAANVDLLDILNKQVAARDECKAFLSTKFGLSIRNILASSKYQAMKACADADMPADVERSQATYQVACQVETVFAIIINEGDEALIQLQQHLNVL